MNRRDAKIEALEVAWRMVDDHVNTYPNAIPDKVDRELRAIRDALAARTLKLRTTTSAREGR